MHNNETVSEVIKRKLPKKSRLIEVAAGRAQADLVLKNARYVNVFSGEINRGDIAVSGGLIAGIGEYEGAEEIDASQYIVTPGLIDSHIHLESSLIQPAEFAKAVVAHGTTTVVVDPHEIANVLGLDGIRYMLEATDSLPIDVLFMLPSCVPSTPLDEAGAVLTQADLEEFYSHPRVLGLAEMMNYTGVVNTDKDVLAKILAAHCHHKKIDGHSPGLSGKGLNAYIAAGIYSDHECDNLDDALEKLRLGQVIMIREGTAAKNLEALAPLLSDKYAGRCMFATDDKHPSDLLNLGHIDHIIRSAISLGVDPLLAVKTATFNPATYFIQNHKGAIAPGHVADLVMVDSLTDFNVKTVIKRGKVVFDNGKVADFDSPVSHEYDQRARNCFHMNETKPSDFASEDLAVLGIIPGEIVTDNLGRASGVDVESDILKIAVVERHKNTGHIGLGYVKGYGLKHGAVATSVAHDSHNIIVVGADDEDISLAVNTIKDNNGGIVVVDNGNVLSLLPLPIAGLMSDRSLEWVNEHLEAAKTAAYGLGVSKDIDPFMTLSFMSLPVIPKVKITTRGVFDVENWKYI